VADGLEELAVALDSLELLESPQLTRNIPAATASSADPNR
jgi:hypothetical protein